MTVLSLSRGPSIAKGVSIVAAGLLSLAAFGAAAQAKSAPTAQAPGVIQLADKRVDYKMRCDANAFRRNGKRIRGIHGEALRKNKRRACGVAMQECKNELRKLRKRTGRYPAARCQVTSTKRVAVRRDLGRNGNPRLILKF